MFPPYLESLNPEQRSAVFHAGNPLLILAGAGSGKTRVITTKIAYLIREKGVDPRSILAVTFTNKAAREMAGRARSIDERAGEAMLRTFHSFGAWFLRRNGALGGLDPGFVIYDDDDAVSLLSSIMTELPKAEIRMLVHEISRAKDQCFSPGDPELELIDSRPLFKKAYAQYEERLAAIGNVDFGDLIKKPVEILRAFPETADRIRDRFRVIMVDEYQDANTAQFELLKELGGPRTYLCVVGDDDQSIYHFRGADVRNILEFPDRFPGTDIIRLERNYRSTEPILAAASSVVSRNGGRLGKTLRSERGPGKKPVLAFLPDQDEEAVFCASLIEKSAAAGNPFGGWAILYRTNAQSLGFETEFLRRRIPYRVVGTLKFYEREEIKDILALLSFLVNPRDEVAFRRVVNKPSRGVGAATVDRIIGALPSGGSLAEAAFQLMPQLSARASSGLKEFFAALEAGRAALGKDTAAEWDDRPPPGLGNRAAGPEAPVKGGGKGKTGGRGGLRAGVGLSACVVALAEASGIAEYHLSRDEISGNQRTFNLQELANAASLYDASEKGLLEFLEHIELDRSIEDSSDKAEDDMATLITLHNTKGLEFRQVIMTGVEQGVFPREDKRGDDLEEERRLFYVGATRAMDELYFTSCAVRRVFGRTMPMEPSLFLREIRRDCIRIIGKAPAGFSGGKSGGEGVPGNGQAAGGRVSSDGRWRLGERVFHDDHGYGEVAEIREGDEGPVIKVLFETGRETRFLSLHQSDRFIKIGED
ncbi:MAG: ATP-dependent helicase [Treponema sp.]|jgi:DNA helicase-2/ATP-dependent DNA helicase PcrA|nr:ATP-dependent helicase [Treponema sp.]